MSSARWRSSRVMTLVQDDVEVSLSSLSLRPSTPKPASFSFITYVDPAGTVTRKALPSDVEL